MLNSVSVLNTPRGSGVELQEVVVERSHAAEARINIPPRAVPAHEPVAKPPPTPRAVHDHEPLSPSPYVQNSKMYDQTDGDVALRDGSVSVVWTPRSVTAAPDSAFSKPGSVRLLSTLSPPTAAAVAVISSDSMSRSSMRTKIIVPDPLENGLGTLSGASVLPRIARQLIAEKAAFAIDSGASNGSQQEERSSASNVRPDYTTAVVREAAAPSNSLSNSYASILSSFRESPRGDVSRSSSTPSTPRTRNNTTNL
jgi:hypothetical protein